MEISNTKNSFGKRKRLREDLSKEEINSMPDKKFKQINGRKSENKISTPCNSENIPKNDEHNSPKNSTLLNYFSKLTTEQLEAQKLKQLSRVTTKAEIHSPDNSPLSQKVNSNSNEHQKNKSAKKKNKSVAKACNDYDEIQVIKTETISPSPVKIVEMQSQLPCQQEKPRWSMKIKLQADEKTISGDDDNYDIFTPRCSQKENMKSSSPKIPKILMPLRNKKERNLDKQNDSPTIEPNCPIIDIETDISKNNSSIDNVNKKQNLQKNSKSCNSILELLNKKGSSNNIQSDGKYSNTEFSREGINETTKSKNKEKSKKRECLSLAETKANNNQNFKSKQNIKNKDSSSEGKNSEDTTIKSIEVVDITNSSLDNNEIIKDLNMETKRKSERKNEIISEYVTKAKRNEKLAPLFTKKSKTTGEVREAKKTSLKTESNDNNNNRGSKPSISHAPHFLPFPKISHIPPFFKFSNSTNLVNNFPLKNYHLDIGIDVLKFRKLNKSPVPLATENIFQLENLEIQEALNTIEQSCSDMHVLWNYISRLVKKSSSKLTVKTRRGTSNSKNKSKKVLEVEENSWEQWSDKYKPRCAAEVVGNEDAAEKLRLWLLSWKKSKENEDYSSSEEFYSSDCSSSNNCNNNKVAVCIGPNGCGKTATVYAIAEEMGYKVLEVNASSRRTGKKILKELEEATKSHRVKKINTLDSMIKSTDQSNKISQNSLILIEDVNIIFEEDEGFISACYQLASNSKRPIVFTLVDNCFHLNKMAPEQLPIFFKPASGERVTALLQLIALSETGLTFPIKYVSALIRNGDLRQALLQLQYFILSRKQCSSTLSLNSRISLREINDQIYKTAIKNDKIRRKKGKNELKKVSTSKTLNTVAHSINSISQLSLLEKSCPTIGVKILKSEPNISLIEDTSSYNILDHTGKEIQEWLKERLDKSVNSNLKKYKKNTDKDVFIAKQKLYKNINFALSHIPTSTLDRQALTLDYLSSIRTICRSEEIRFKTNSKRGNRFFHYFQGTGIPRFSSNPSNLLFSTCKMFQDLPEDKKS